MNLKKPVVKKIVAAITDKVKQEKLFEAVYKWVEKQERDSTLDKNDSIKSEIGTFLPYINFYKMDISFLIQSVVPRGFIFSSLDVLSKILYSVNPRMRKVTVTNIHGQRIFGYPLLNQAITNSIKTLTLPCYKSGCSDCLWKGKFEMPSTPSFLHKRNDVEWYLVIFSGGEIGLVHSTSVCGHYLLAEMAQEEGGNFYITPGCKIEIE
uniref:Uncharacterized protein n=1 Tax=Panagrolaimus davidi TaxID=227884 RepID=A0A914QC10_9BILA